MILLKIPYFLILGLLKLIVFMAVALLYPVCILPALLMEVGGLKGASDTVHKKFEWIANKITEYDE